MNGTNIIGVVTAIPRLREKQSPKVNYRLAILYFFSAPTIPIHHPSRYSLLISLLHFSGNGLGVYYDEERGGHRGKGNLVSVSSEAVSLSKYDKNHNSNFTN